MASYQFTQAEIAAALIAFRAADTTSLGFITGKSAVAFFEKANLPTPTLGDIWSLTDSDNTGFLTREKFTLACRLIGHAQRGETLRSDLLMKPGEPPKFTGISYPSAAIPKTTASNMQPMKGATQSTADTAGPLSMSGSDAQRYLRIFLDAKPNPPSLTGTLTRTTAQEIFVKSKLPFNVLMQIWSLADIQRRGELSSEDFCVGMWAIQHVMDGSLSSVPNEAPTGLRQSASAAIRAAMPGSAHSRSASLAPEVSAPQAPLSAAPRSFTSMASPAPSTASRSMSLMTDGGGSPAQASVTSPLQSRPSSFATPPSSAKPTAAAAVPWAISSQEFARSNTFFSTLDTSGRNRLSSSSAGSFFLQSKLPEADLAKIWDLVDIRKDGELDREEFAVALRLIQSKIAGKPVPDELPQSLIPLSLRSVASANPQKETVRPAVSETLQDLFSLEDTPPATGATNAGITAFAGALPSPLPASASIPPTPALSTAAVAGSRAPTPRQPTGAVPSSAAVLQQFAPSAAAAQQMRSMMTSPGLMDEPLDVDADNARLAETSLQVRNMEAQHASTSKMVEVARASHADTQRQLAETEAQRAQISARLEQIRSERESTEGALVDLKNKLKESKLTLETERQNVIRAESELSAVRMEQNELQQTVMRDKEEVLSMKSTLKELSEQTAAIKLEVDALKKEARQQKGLVAIGKKQLSTAEHEQDELQKEQRSLITEKETAAALAATSANATQVPVGAALSATVAGAALGAAGAEIYDSTNGQSEHVSNAQRAASPTPSVISGRSFNPFDVSNRAERSTSPGPSLPAPAFASFSDAFGPAEPAASTNETAPPQAGVSRSLSITSNSSTSALGGSQTTKSRAAPPPPPVRARHVTPSATLVSATNTEAKNVSFDDDFGSSYLPPTKSMASTGGGAHDAVDFDSAFAGFDEPTRSSAIGEPFDLSVADTARNSDSNQHPQESINDDPTHGKDLVGDNLSETSSEEEVESVESLPPLGGVGHRTGAHRDADGIAGAMSSLEQPGPSIGREDQQLSAGFAGGATESVLRSTAAADAGTSPLMPMSHPSPDTAGGHRLAEGTDFGMRASSSEPEDDLYANHPTEGASQAVERSEPSIPASHSFTSSLDGGFPTGSQHDDVFHDAAEEEPPGAFPAAPAGLSDAVDPSATPRVGVSNQALGGGFGPKHLESHEAESQFFREKPPLEATPQTTASTGSPELGPADAQIQSSKIASPRTAPTAPSRTSAPPPIQPGELPPTYEGSDESDWHMVDPKSSSTVNETRAQMGAAAGPSHTMSAFDDAFADLEPARPADKTVQADFLPEMRSGQPSFEESFNSDPFGSQPAALSQAPVPSRSQPPADLFADFDDAFIEQSAPSAPPRASTEGVRNASSIPFSSPVTPAQQRSTSSVAAASPTQNYLSKTRRSAPLAPGRQKAVEQLEAMGFTREQSLDALEKFDFDPERAANSLLGM